MSFRESVIIPYSLFKKCQFATPPPAAAIPPPPRETTPESDEPPAPPEISTPPTFHQEQKPKFPPSQTDENESTILTMARVVPEEDRPILENILKRIYAHPDIIRWNSNLEVILDGVIYPKSNIVDILKFIMKRQVIENNKGAPFGGKEFVDNLLKINVPKDWIKVSFVRKSKRGFRGMSPEDEDEEEEEEQQFAKKRRTQSGTGLFPWISY